MKNTASKKLNAYVKKGLFYESVVEDGSDIIFVLDFDANILYHNASVKGTLGYGTKALVGKNFFDFVLPAELNTCKRQFTNCKRKSYCQGIEFQFLCKDNSYRFLEFNSINLKQQQGIPGLIMDCRDITQRKKDAEELLLAQKARDLFVANISHEIRTPINGISGMATLLSNNPSIEESRTYLNAIKSASENLKVIINDILDLSAIESGRLRLERVGFNMQDLVTSMMDSFKAQARAKNLELTSTIDEKSKGVFIGDPVRLNQILINLIGNALKFTHHGSIALQVSVLKAGKKYLLQFEVADTGIGVPKDKLTTIFERFSQADASVTRKYGGTGLGLTIVKQLIEMQKGWITVKSAENEGTTFTVAIPYTPAPIGSRYVDSQGLNVPKEIIDLGGFTILLVEDNEINRLYAGGLLKKCGCKIEMAENGLEALNKLKEVRVDLILMDIQMPVMDGFQASKAIRTGSTQNNVPIIALTANATPSIIEKCISLGMNDHIGKPFTPEELFFKLEKYLTLSNQHVVQQPEAISVQNNFAIVNLSFLAKVSDGDLLFIKDVVASFLQATPNLLVAIQEAMTQSSPEKISRLIHRLKPSLSMMGMTATKELAEYLEDELNVHGISSEVKEKMGQFCKEISLAIKELSDY